MENEQNYNPEEITAEYYDAIFKDLQDLEILRTQAGGLIALVLGYLFDYMATNQAIELLEARMELRDKHFSSGVYSGEDNEQQYFGLEENDFQNRGVDADRTALIAANLELSGQTVLTYLDGIKLQRFNENMSNRDLLISRTANEEIFIGAVFGEISFIYNLQGVQLLYDTSNQNTLND